MENQKHLTFGQGQLAQIIIGLIVVILALRIDLSDATNGQPSDNILGLNLQTWYVIALLLPYVHQVVIAPLWRWELLDRKMTAVLGSTDRAFGVFKVVFALFFFPRLLIAVPVAILTRNTLSFPLHLILMIISVPLSAVALYGMYSVIRYFKINRAFGADHFFDEYRNLPRVDKGLFKYTSNAMYTYVLAITWLPTVFLGSAYGIGVGLFNHLFVWVHYYFIEKPDMDFIYG